MAAHQAIAHVLRRSLSQTPTEGNAPQPQDLMAILHDALTPGAATLLILTVLIFIAVLTAIRYTLLIVVATNAQVESPTHSYVPLDNQAPKPFSDAGEPMIPNDPEVILIQDQAITGSIRRTLKHLQARAGYLARFRGFWCAVCYAVLSQLLLQLLGPALSYILPFTVAHLLTGTLISILLARWDMAWTHVVISDPSPLPWYRRVPTFATWRKIWAPTAIAALTKQFAFVVPMVLWVAFGFNDVENAKAQSPVAAGWKVFTILLVALLTYVFIVIPSQVALTRCQASMLPEEDESIVPFDRSYGGKVVPAIVGGSGMLSYVDAWKSFDRPARIRLVKLYAKILAVDVGLHLAFMLVLTLQLMLVLKKTGKGVPDREE